MESFYPAIGLSGSFIGLHKDRIFSLEYVDLPNPGARLQWGIWLWCLLDPTHLR